MDTGSSFEGMGASREVTFSALSEPALLIGLAAIAKCTGYISLTQMFQSVVPELWVKSGPVLVLAGVALLIVFLAENCRIPVDDPTTHLELTMIHEVMVLDHGGPDFGFILYSAALKMWLLGQILDWYCRADSYRQCLARYPGSDCRDDAAGGACGHNRVIDGPITASACSTAFDWRDNAFGSGTGA